MTNLLNNIETKYNNDIAELKAKQQETEDILKEVHSRNTQLDIDLRTSNKINLEQKEMLRGLNFRLDKFIKLVEMYKTLTASQAKTIKDLTIKVKESKPQEDHLKDNQFYIHLLMTLMTLFITVYIFKG